MPKAPCYFFASGRCKKGDECLFSHDVPNNKDKTKESGKLAKGSEAKVDVVLRVAERAQAMKDRRKEDIAMPSPTMVLAQATNVLASI